MTQQLAIKFGKFNWIAYNLKDVVFMAGEQKGLSKSQVKRLIKQGAVEIYIFEDSEKK